MTVKSSDLASNIPFSENSYGEVKRVVVFREWLNDLREKRRRGLRVLEFGCGTGGRLLRLLDSGMDVLHGVDIHPPSIETARAMYSSPTLSFSTDSLDDLIAAGERYDVVICSEVLEHVSDPAATMRAVRRLLVADGRVFVTIPNGYGSYEQLHRLQKVMARVGLERVIDALKAPVRARRQRARRTSGHDNPPADTPGYLNVESGHIQFFSLDEIRRLFRATGFEMEIERGKMLLCGSYADFLLRAVAALPGGRAVYTLNTRVADLLPVRTAADWMFLLRPSTTGA